MVKKRKNSDNAVVTYWYYWYR